MSRLCHLRQSILQIAVTFRARQKHLGNSFSALGRWTGYELGAIIASVFACLVSLPFFLIHPPERSFLLLARRVGSGRFFESYSVFQRLYRLTLTVGFLFFLAIVFWLASLFI